MKDISFFVFSIINVFNILCSNIVQGIRGGKDVAAGHFTHHVSVLINGDHACGGSIIDYQHVLTAAQCVLDEKGYFLDVKLEVLAGVDYLESRSFSKFQEEVAYVYIKFDYRPPGKSHDLSPNAINFADIAVLKLKNRFTFKPNSVLKPAMLPVKLTGSYRKYFYKSANVSGFGQDMPTTYKSASYLTNLYFRRNSRKQLKYATIRVGRYDTCLKKYKQIQESHICGHSVNDPDIPTGACDGDVGGPLIFEDSYVIGILSKYADGCDDRAVFAVYTRVSSFIDFIESALRGEFEVDMRYANYTDTHVDEIFHPLLSR